MPVTFRLRKAVVGIRGGRMVKHKGRAASIAPGLLIGTVASVAMGLSGATPANAQTFIETVGPAENYTVAQGDAVSVEIGDAEDPDDFWALAGIAPNYTAQLSNSGSLDLTVTGGTASGGGGAMQVGAGAVGLAFQGNISSGSVFNTDSGTLSVTA